MSLLQTLQEASLQNGFLAASGVDWHHLETQRIYREHADRYARWIEEKRHSEMGYLERGLDRRLNPKLVFPKLQSAFVVLSPYSAAPRPEGSASSGPEYARYLSGPDYHKDLKARLEQVMRSAPGVGYKICVDTSSVLERTWAVLAGLGWVGKNTLLIHPQFGSFVFIGVVFLDQELGNGPQLLKDYCGSCTRCLTACPTQAFTQSHWLDSGRCISAATLEIRTPLSEALTLTDRAQNRAWIAGCDRCQEVCPFNSKAAKSAPQLPAPFAITTWLEHARETESEYNARVANSSLKRVKYPQARRNLARALRDAELPTTEKQALLSLLD